MDKEKRPKLAYSVAEIAIELGLSEAFIRKEIAALNIKVTRFGTRVVVLAADLQKYIDSKAEAA